MNTLATIVGVLGVCLYISSYQFKKRKTIVAVYTCANLMYIIQYLLLGAYSGMAMDTLGAVSSILAQKRNTEFMKKHFIKVIVLVDSLIVLVGMLLYKNIFSLFSIGAVLVETTALWLKRERSIRILTLCSTPLWFVYNMTSGAYGSAAGSVINFFCISYAIYRYHIKTDR